MPSKMRGHLTERRASDGRYPPRIVIYREAHSDRSIRPTAQRVGRGSLTGRWQPQPGAYPNIRGGITIERDLRAGTKLWLTGWTKSIVGGEYVLLLVEIADKDGRPCR